jgi:hypothetical protein
VEEQATVSPGLDRLTIAAIALAVVSCLGVLYAPLIAAVLALAAILAGVVAFVRPRTSATQRPLAVAAVILGGLIVLIVVAYFLLAGLLFMDSPSRPAVGAGDPLAQADPDGDYLLNLMETRYYRSGREIERTGFALVIMTQEPLPRPGPDETFIYLDIALRNATDEDLIFAPAGQFRLEDADGRTFEFPTYALPEEYSGFILDDEDHPLGVIRLPANSEMPIYFETVISLDSHSVVLVFDPDPSLADGELKAPVSR